MQTSSGPENHLHLRQLFEESLLALKPRSVLDVGAGSGALVARCRAEKTPATGVDPDPECVASAKSKGLDLTCSEAEELPFEDGQFDWVTMRHVPHHLVDVRAAFAEATRVARSGLLIAEPWYDVEEPSQRNSLEVDRWLKTQHRNAGRVHAEAMDQRELTSYLPAGKWNIHCWTELRLRGRTLEDFQLEAAPWLERLPADHADRSSHAALVGDIERDGLSWNGSLILRATFAANI